MAEKAKKKLILLLAGLIMIVLSIAIAVLIFSLQFDELWWWYSALLEKLNIIEDYIAHIDKEWLFVGAILLLFTIKTYIPIYATSTVCFLTGAVLPMYIAVPVNIVGFAWLLTVRYYIGKRFGAGNAWKMIRKNETLRRLIQQDGKGNPALLVALRLIPCFPINSISSIYGSFNFGYRKFMILSIIGFLPKLLSFTFVGRNVFDPLSKKFLVPLMIMLFLAGVSVVCINGVWITVERIISYFKRKREYKEQKKGKK